MTEIEQLIRAQDWVYPDAGTCWQDGLILGNGSLGTIGYAPYGLEWVINKNDVFDGRVARNELTPHREVMSRFLRERPPTLGFLGELETTRPGVTDRLSKPAAVLRLGFGDEASWGAARPHRVRQRLSLWEGELYYELDMHGSHPRLRCLVPRERNLFCLRLEQCGGTGWRHLLELSRSYDEDQESPVWQTADGVVGFTQTMTHGTATYAVALLAVPTAGPNPKDPIFSRILPRWRPTESTVGTGTHGVLHGNVPQAGNADLFLAVVTSYEAADPARAALAEVRRAAKIGFPALERETRRWWRSFWRRGWADFGAEREIQRYWTFSLYETACLLRRAPVPGLYGLWHGPTKGPQLGISAADYTHDQNIQIPMMPIFALNRVDLVEPFVDTYLELLPKLRAQTRALFGKRPGVYLPLSMNPLGDDLGGGAGRYTWCGGAYSGLILVWAWRYSRDRQLLQKKLYPLLRELVRFHVAAMEMGKDGRYHLEWEVPPELFTMSRDCLATLALLKPCLETVVEAAGLLGCDRREAAHWRDVLAHYPDLPRRVRGDWWAGTDVPEDHYSQGAYHLYPFFPAEMCVDAEGEKTAAFTLEHLPEHDIEVSYADRLGHWHYDHAWPWFFPALTRLRLGQREQGWQELHECLRLYFKPNGLASHNPVVAVDPAETEANLKNIPSGQLRHADGSLAPRSEFQSSDGNSAATLHPQAARWVTPAVEANAAFLQAATEALLQSHGGLIRLFPCVPKKFTGGFCTLLAQGAFEVSARMEKGKLASVEIRALRGGIARVVWPWLKTWRPQLPVDCAEERSHRGEPVLCLPLKRNEIWRAELNTARK